MAQRELVSSPMDVAPGPILVHSEQTKLSPVPFQGHEQLFVVPGHGSGLRGT